MARNRQKAKERQARRRAQQQGDGAAAPEPSAPAQQPDSEPEAQPELSESEQLRSGAPPTDLGTAESVLEYEQDLDEQTDQEHFDPAEDHPEEDDALSGGPRGVRGDSEEAHKDRSRVVQFLYAVVAELRRVQWPDRQTLTTLTGVVLGFVVIAGGYLGLLDAIFSRVIQAIL